MPIDKLELEYLKTLKKSGELEKVITDKLELAYINSILEGESEKKEIDTNSSKEEPNQEIELMR